ncbi:hypothetical protein F5880DRAFT_1504527 [Lentinula raphanica]|nr:hypothetical protein F5880DRAFT_1504527 [Lentinula raphanica]
MSARDSDSDFETASSESSYSEKRPVWASISIDDREAMEEYEEFFWDINCPGIVDYLMNPVIPSKSTYIPDKTSLGHTSHESVINHKAPTSTATLLNIPAELLLLIIEDLGDDYLHLLCFSLTCTLLWELSGQALYHSLVSRVKKHSWAGSRVILLSDRTESLPETMVLSDKDIEELQLDGPRQKHGRALYRASETFQYPSLPRVGLLKGDKRVEDGRDLAKELLEFCNVDEKRFGFWIRFHWKDFKPHRQQGDRWILRNFSKREYVTKGTSRDLTQYIYLLIGCGNPMPDPWLSNGRWAGDRLDVTLVSMHEQEYANDSDWKDITTHVKKIIWELFHNGDLVLSE